MESDNEEESLQSQSDEPDDQFIEQNVSDTSSNSNSANNSSSSDQSNLESEASTNDVEDSTAMPAFLGSNATRSNFEATFLALSKKHKFAV